MVASSAALGLLGTAALLSMYARMPGLHSPSRANRHSALSSSTQLHKRYTNPYNPQRQYLDPAPPRFSLDRFVNRIFRRPYLADVRPPAYRRPVPYRPAPIWHSQSPYPIASNSYYTYSQYGMPMASKPLSKPAAPAKNSKPNTSKHSKKSRNHSKGSGKTGSIKRKLKNDVHQMDDDDYDDHIYVGDFDQFDPFHHSDDDESLKGSSANNAPPPAKSSQAKSSKDNSGEEYQANPSNQAISKRKSRAKYSTTTTSTTTTTQSSKDCSPATKVNYHYHMYMIKQLAAQKKTKTTTSAPTTTTTATVSTYPVYEATAASKTATYQSVAPAYVQSTSTAPSSHSSVPQSVIEYSGHKEPNSDYFYQVVTSSSYIESGDPHAEMSSNEETHKSPTHFDSDYYNSVLLSKILGLNPGAKAMPLENYATESTGNGPLVKYDKSYKNSKSIDASKIFQMDSNSNLYVTLGRPNAPKSKVGSKQ